MTRSLHFHERMNGWVSFAERSYNQALALGKREGTACAQELEIAVDDVDRFIADRSHTAAVTGAVRCDALGGRWSVEPGSTFNLFVDADGVRHKRMLYRLLLRDGDGRALTLSGFKDVHDDPGLDIWADTTRLFVRLLSGHVLDEPYGDRRTVATGILYVTHLALLRMMGSFRGSGGALGTARSVARFTELFVGELFAVYDAPASATASEDFPSPTESDPRWQGKAPGTWHEVEDKPGLYREILPFHAADPEQTPLTLHHLRAERDPARGPVMLFHGTGVRANLFYGSPGPTLVEALLEEGYDVWVPSWRASIDLPPRQYTLDQAAAYDHPAAVAEVKRLTGSPALKAVIHCQGSTSLTMSALAGLVPEFTTIVSNAVSLCVDVPMLSNLKLRALVPPMRRLLPGLDPQWAARAPTALSARVARLARLIRGRDCDNEFCQVSNYMYGVGPNLLWRHENLDDDTHEWISREFGFCPFSFFAQMGRCEQAGHLVPVSGLRSIPEDLMAQEPATEARWAFIAGSLNRLFLPSGQRRAYEHFSKYRPNYHSHHELPGFTHLDVMFGRRSARDVFPLILRELADEGVPRRV